MYQVKADGSSLLCPSPIITFHSQIVLHDAVFAFKKNYLHKADIVGITFFFLLNQRCLKPLTLKQVARPQEIIESTPSAPNTEETGSGFAQLQRLELTANVCATIQVKQGNK